MIGCFDYLQMEFLYGIKKWKFKGLFVLLKFEDVNESGLKLEFVFGFYVFG